MKKLVFFTGAGISQESGIKTFRDSDGLWEGYDVNQVASIEGWYKNPELVLDFYNQRRRQLLSVLPNNAHYAIASLQDRYDVTVVTQNVDDLHERAGAKKVIHLHGELLKSRSIKNNSKIYHCTTDIKLGDVDEHGDQLRPHIVWFGEMVPMLEYAIETCSKAEIFVVVGTSLQVYPAANALEYVLPGVPFYYIDPNPALNPSLNRFYTSQIISEKATTGMKKLEELLK